MARFRYVQLVIIVATFVTVCIFVLVNFITPRPSDYDFCKSLSFDKHVTIQIRHTKATVYLADTPEKKQCGLMFFDEMVWDGMLFIYPDEKERVFWMKNTMIPLSIAFIDQYGFIQKIAHMTHLNQEAAVQSEVAVNQVLEVPDGWFTEHGITVGDKLEIISRKNQ